MLWVIHNFTNLGKTHEWGAYFGVHRVAFLLATCQNPPEPHEQSAAMWAAENPEEFFYAQRAEALGVQSRGGDRKSEINTPNGAKIPSQEEHADSIGVGHRTVNRWERDRKEINTEVAMQKIL